MILLILASYFAVENGSKNKIYTSVDQLPNNNVALVLGTSQYLRSGIKNPFFTYRIDAAERLYKTGKVNYLLVSGDNRIANYNEPEKMRRELIERGIPNEKIILDYAGFRTLDSVVRSKKVFGQRSITIVSQDFHNKRALFIANFFQIDAVAFNAQDVSLKTGIKTSIREVFARVKMILDLYILKKEPHFLGDPINIPNKKGIQ
jgi:SanA protein